MHVKPVVLEGRYVRLEPLSPEHAALAEITEGFEFLQREPFDQWFPVAQASSDPLFFAAVVGASFQAFLFLGIQWRQVFHTFEMRPSVGIAAEFRIVAEGQQDHADADVHQLHLLVFFEIAGVLAEFLHPDQENESVQVHRSLEAGFHPLHQIAPALVELQIHTRSSRVLPERRRKST